MVIAGLFTVAMMIASAFALVLLVATTKGWRRAIPGAGATMLIVGAVVLVGMITLSPYANVSPTPDVTEKDFCQVVWEEKTTEGKVMVIVKNSAGNFLFSEFDEPLGAKKILVVEKGRFQPFPPAEKPAPVTPKQ